MDTASAGELKTIRQIADELGVSKQRVYRNIRMNRIDAHRDDAGVMWYDEAAQAQIRRNFSHKERVSEARRDAHQSTSRETVADVLIATLREELEIKNRQIADLTTALDRVTATLQAAQALHAGTMQQNLTDGGKRGLFSRLFGTRD